MVRASYITQAILGYSLQENIPTLHRLHQIISYRRPHLHYIGYIRLFPTGEHTYDYMGYIRLFPAEDTPMIT
jgi:hypothetical protein